ncbi:hypothetical protein PVW46_11120 [Mameliella sp. AT18]|uniref:hypothetical protein n=1 Tax=Mameliella sp. AT18 TaxID=3028385 RepID=UPI00237BCD42|nr:hypothetical protein [Mameliella sp. AT18]MDD9730459.1 hypothetical protein [Mameliella sp. AT18]
MSMDPKTLSELSDTYVKYLEELVDRIWVIVWITQEMKKGEPINQYLYVDMELCALQLRKSLEVVGYMCLLAHRPEIGKFNSKLKKIYKPNEIFKQLRSKNTSYFPVATVVKEDGENKEFVEVGLTNTGIPLSEKDYLKAYAKFCGPRMHANSEFKYRSQSEIEDAIDYARSTALGLLSLIGLHKINVGQKYILHAGINDRNSGKPFAQVFSRVGP